ncbi:YusU family protein [uncultured Metabacillus sp.]|uniref:YusU family protein n=1 Tax=uncultured Metabacillus sp. TaxID=2860135 RepID=UPI00262EE213|nr:YusU family protein [uncultured Metabacillus sp.]
MDHELVEKFDGLLEKYTELLLGDASDELMEKVKMWALYSHIAKSMPPLVKHWNATYPDAKNELKTLINEIKALNEKHRESANNK